MGPTEQDKKSRVPRNQMCPPGPVISSSQSEIAERGEGAPRPWAVPFLMTRTPSRATQQPRRRGPAGVPVSWTGRSASRTPTPVQTSDRGVVHHGGDHSFPLPAPTRCYIMLRSPAAAGPGRLSLSLPSPFPLLDSVLRCFSSIPRLSFSPSLTRSLVP